MIHKTKGIGFPKCFSGGSCSFQGNEVFVLIGGVTANKEKKTALLSIQSSLVQRNPFFMAYYNPHIIVHVVFHPLYTLNN